MGITDEDRRLLIGIREQLAAAYGAGDAALMLIPRGEVVALADLAERLAAERFEAKLEASSEMARGAATSEQLHRVVALVGARAPHLYEKVYEALATPTEGSRVAVRIAEMTPPKPIMVCAACAANLGLHGGIK